MLLLTLEGVKPLFTPAMWQTLVPPKVQMFLWRLVNNKPPTVDNVNKNGEW
jgi:hypothetical protein